MYLILKISDLDIKSRDPKSITLYDYPTTYSINFHLACKFKASAYKWVLKPHQLGLDPVSTTNQHCFLGKLLTCLPHYTMKPKVSPTLQLWGFQRQVSVVNVKLFPLQYIIFISETHLHKVEFTLKRQKQFYQIYINKYLTPIIIKKRTLKRNNPVQ